MTNEIKKEPSNKKSILTQERLKHVLSYDQETGIFTRNYDHKNGLKAGSIAGTKMGTRKVYLCVRIDRILYLCHRLAWLYVFGVYPNDIIDHVNGDGCDNRIANLRDVSNEQNVQATLRMPIHNTSGFKGVYWSKRARRWVAGISIKNKRKFIGAFNTAEEASDAYLSTKRLIHFQ